MGLHDELADVRVLIASSPVSVDVGAVLVDELVHALALHPSEKQRVQVAYQ